jgi:phosphoribosylaminoimidazole-succinocarboxamide synthase
VDSAERAPTGTLNEAGQSQDRPIPLRPNGGSVAVAVFAPSARTLFAMPVPPVGDRSLSEALLRSDLDLPGRREGKVRDLYELPPDADGRPRLLIVATDRLSAFDVVLPTAAPGKGVLLTATSLWWFRRLRERGIVEDHVIHADAAAIPDLSEAERRMLAGRAMVSRAASVVPIECVARGHLAGSGLAEYRATGRICGLELPAGLAPGDRLPTPIFTPATKAATGHDENVPFEHAAALVGGDLMERLRSATLALYEAAHAEAALRGLVLADTKFEFGFALDAGGEPTRRLLLVDEILTSDSSRYWPAESIGGGRVPAGFDKQPLRDWLQTECDAGRWDKAAPGPHLPDEVVEALLQRYRGLARRLGAIEE